MSGLMNDPAFQRALLKQRAQAIGGGQSFNTVGLTSAFAADRLQRDLQFEGISDAERRGLKGISQRGQMLNIDRKRVGLAQDNFRQDKNALPLTIGIGLGTSLISGLEGRRRKQLISEDNRLRAAQLNQILNTIAYQKQSNRYGGRD